MAKKEFTFRGKYLQELQAMSIEELAQLLPARPRRKIKRGFSDAEKTLLKRLTKSKKDVETHCREMIVLPSMVGRIIKVYNGKEFVPVAVMPEMIGHYLGEFSFTRKRVSHSAPGIGATRSSASVAVK